MYDTMYEASGVGLAAPQVGVQKRIFTFDVGEGPQVLINPEIVEATGEWVYEEGCLSIPGFHFEIVRPKVVTMPGLDLDGNEVIIEGDELLGRVFLHEIDHLDGVLMLDRLDPDERKRALRDAAASRTSRPSPRERAGSRRLSAIARLRDGAPRLLRHPRRRGRAPSRRCSRPATTSPLVVTQPDRRRGRGSGIDAEPGEARGARARPRGRDPGTRPRGDRPDVAATGAELGVVVAFGQLLPPALARRAARTGS